MDKDLSKYGFIPEAQIEDNSLSDYGFVPETAEEKKKRELYEKFDMPVVAGAAGVARGLTFGLSDATAKAFGLDDELAALKEVNPTASTIGEVTGAVGGAFLGPGALVARGAAAASKGLASQVMARAAAAGLEGAAYGVGQTISEESLKENGFKPEEVAESLLANVGVGALLGGGFSLGASAVGAGGSKLSSKVQKFFSGADEAANASKPKSLIERQGEFLKEQLGVEKKNIAQVRNAAFEEGIPLTQSQTSGSPIVQDIRSSLTQSPTFLGSGERQADDLTRDALIRRGQDLLSDASTKTEDQIGAQLKGQVDEIFKKRHSEISEAYDSLEPDFRRIKVSTDQKERGAKSFLNNELIGIDPTGGEAKLAANFARQLQNIENLSQLKILRTKVNGEISKAVRTGDTNALSVLQNVKSQINVIRDESIERASLQATGGVKADALEVTQDVVRSIKSTDKKYAELNKEATEFAEKMGFGKVKNVKKLYEKLETIPNEKFARKLFNTDNAGALRYLNKNFPEQFENLRRFELGQILQASLKEDQIHIPSLMRATKNLSPEATKMLFGAQGARSLKNLKTLQDAFPKMVGPSGTKQAIDYNNLLSPFLYIGDAVKLAAIKGAPLVEKAMGEQNKLIAERLTQFLKPVSRSAQLGTVKSVLLTNGDYETRLNELSELASNPEALSEKVAQSTKGISSYNQEVADAVNQRMVESIAFLQMKAPKNPHGPEVFGETKWRPSDAEISKWNRYVKAVDSPLSILDDFRARVLTPESVEAVKTIYPEIYQKMAKAAFNYVSTEKKKLNYDEKLQLSILLQVPVSSTINPDFIRKLQADYPETESEDAQNGGGARLSKKANLAQSTMSPVEKIVSR